MEQWNVLVCQIWAIAWHRRWLLVAVAWGVCLIGWAGVYLIPDSYESEARLYVDTDAVLTPLLHGIAINTRTLSQLEMMQKTLLSRPNLSKLIDTTSLNLEATSSEKRQQLMRLLPKEIAVTSEGHNLFTIHYRSTNPQLAYQVVSGLVNIFMERATGSNTADMQNAQRFLNEQIASLEVQLRAAEKRRANFLSKYFDILNLRGGASPLDGARRTVAQLEAQLKDAEMRQAALREELRITPRLLTSAVGGGTGGSAASQLAAAEAKLAELRAKDTEENPDVVMARSEVEALRAAARRAPVSGAMAGRDGLTLANPVYEQLKLRLIEAGVAIAGLQRQLDTARKQLAHMESLARAVPEVQAKYENLDRGYSVLRKNYQDLLERREASVITAAADTGADRVRLRVVDPPQVPLSPVAPNRPILDSVVLLAGFGAAVGLAFLLYETDESITDIGHLRELGPPVLGGISIVPSSSRRRKVYYQGLSVLATLLCLIVLYGGLAIQIIPRGRIFL